MAVLVIDKIILVQQLDATVFFVFYFTNIYCHSPRSLLVTRSRFLLLNPERYSVPDIDCHFSGLLTDYNTESG
jgi:hypothetical protein